MFTVLMLYVSLTLSNILYIMQKDAVEFTADTEYSIYLFYVISFYALSFAGYIRLQICRHYNVSCRP